MESIAENRDNSVAAEHEDRICAACAHLVGRRTFYETGAEWKCHAKQNVLGSSKDLVTGKIIYELRFSTCYLAREDHFVMLTPSEAKQLISCGTVAQWFDLYTRPDYSGFAPADPEKLLKELE